MGCERLFSAQLVVLLLSGLPSLLPARRVHGQPDVEVVYPTLVDRHGRLLSTDLSPWSSEHHRRERRSVRLGEDVYLNITGKKHQFLLHLTPNRRLLAPGFRVYLRHYGNQSDASGGRLDQDPDPGLDPDCLMKGDVIAPGHGRAAVSLCSAGVTGVLQLDDDDFVIEPMTEQNARDVTLDRGGNPHVIYQRASLKMSENSFESQEGGVFGQLADSLTQWPTSYRSRRSPHKHRHGHGDRPRRKREWQVETLVVVDKTMYWRHGKRNITNYVLSIFNIVSQLFSDVSLGANVQIVLVGLVLMDGNEPGLSISHHADKTLNSFCQWQSLLTGDNGKHHDHAILLTGLDICSYKNAPCDTLGFAPIKGMCSPMRSCIVNQDTGLTTAFTVAHEIGHNFGLFHDGDGNYCKQAPGNIMAPTLTGHNGKFRWSVCSRGYMQRFLSTPQANCLTDDALSVPRLRFPEKLPGELFDADVQCKWQFGSRAHVCSFDSHQRGRMCQTLWCLRGEQMCETKFLPAAEGTACGPDMWCRHGSCVQRAAVGPLPVDGEWSSWTAWSQCSRTCGGGVMQRDRVCNNPSPAHGGKHCDGDAEMFKMCGLGDCPGGTVDPRWEQCQHHNRQPFRGWYYKWKPYTQVHHVEDQCKLYCQAENYNFFYALANEVEDGTRCNDHNNDICIKGVCKSVGCDLVINSAAKNDRCGVCKGDNSSCQVITGIYSEQPKHDTYFPIVVLPRGARSISVREREMSMNYLAVRNIYGDYYLNGNRRMHWAGKYNFGDALFSYLRPASEPETLTSQGPLGEDLVLEILVKGWNPGILYEYTLPKSAQVPVRVPPYNCRWELAVYGCSKLCAGGERIAEPHCVCGEGKNVSDSLCDQASKPKTQIEPCNTDPCPPRWVVQDWGKCSKSCGGGKQRRKVKCRQEAKDGADRKLKPRDCRHLPRPPRKRTCNVHNCPASWQKGRWSQCSVTCGRGTRVRDVGCYSQTTGGTRPMPDIMCQGRPRPRSSRPCSRQPCHKFQWVISSWGYCSVTCGSGVRVRSLRCVRQKRSGQLVKTRDRHCRKVSKPTIELQQQCEQSPCAVHFSTTLAHHSLPLTSDHTDLSSSALTPESSHRADPSLASQDTVSTSSSRPSPRTVDTTRPASPRNADAISPASPRTVDVISPRGRGTVYSATPRNTGTVSPSYLRSRGTIFPAYPRSRNTAYPGGPWSTGARETPVQGSTGTTSSVYPRTRVMVPPTSPRNVATASSLPPSSGNTLSPTLHKTRGTFVPPSYSRTVDTIYPPSSSRTGGTFVPPASPRTESPKTVGTLPPFASPRNRIASQSPASRKLQNPDATKSSTISAEKHSKSDPPSTSIRVSSVPEIYLSITTTKSKGTETSGRIPGKPVAISTVKHTENHTKIPTRQSTFVTQETLKSSHLPVPQRDRHLSLNPVETSATDKVDFIVPSQTRKVTTEVSLLPVDFKDDKTKSLHLSQVPGMSTQSPSIHDSSDRSKVSPRLFTSATHSSHNTSPKSHTSTQTDNVSKISSQSASSTTEILNKPFATPLERSTPPVSSTSAYVTPETSAHTPSSARSVINSVKHGTTKSTEKDASQRNVGTHEDTAVTEPATARTIRPSVRVQNSTTSHSSVNSRTSSQDSSRSDHPAQTVKDQSSVNPESALSTSAAATSEENSPSSLEKSTKSESAVGTRSPVPGSSTPSPRVSSSSSAISAPTLVASTSTQVPQNVSDMGRSTSKLSSVASPQNPTHAERQTTPESTGVTQRSSHTAHVSGVTESTLSNSSVAHATAKQKAQIPNTSSGVSVPVTLEADSTTTGSSRAPPTRVSPTRGDNSGTGIAQSSSPSSTTRSTEDALLRANWVTSLWSQCSVTCGEGERVRLVRCMDRQQRHMTASACTGSPPPSRQQCSAGPCPPAGPACVDAYPWCRLVPVHNICNHSFYGRKCCHSCRGYK